MFIDLRERERNIDWLSLFMPQPGIKPTTFMVYGTTLQPMSHPARANTNTFYLSIIPQ